MILYDFELSGNCYKIRLMLSLLGQDYEKKSVQVAAGENKAEAFLQLNPKGEVPVLEDSDQIFADSGAILVYLATQYGEQYWLPCDAVSQARIQYWLATASNEIQHGPSAARVIKLFNVPWDYAQAVQITDTLLPQIDQHLSQHHWLAAEHVTIADIAVYPYLALAEEGDINLGVYRHIRQWQKQIEALPNYIALPQATAMA